MLLLLLPPALPPVSLAAVPCIIAHVCVRLYHVCCCHLSPPPSLHAQLLPLAGSKLLAGPRMMTGLLLKLLATPVRCIAHDVPVVPALYFVSLAYSLALPLSPHVSPTHIGAAGPSHKLDAPTSASGDIGGALSPLLDQTSMPNSCAAAWVSTRIELVSMYEYSDLNV